VATPPDSILSLELEAALLRALKATWHDLNQSHFKGALAPPALELGDGASRLGAYHPGTRTIVLARALAVGGAWGTVVEVLKHEMAHQFVAEVLGDPDDGPHGAAFRAVCERAGIDARAAGLPPAGAPPHESGAERVLGRVAKLLALAASQNRHEAELAMAEAQRLMLKHNIESTAPGRYGFRHLGRATGRISEAERILACILSDHFFVEVIWVPVWRAQEGRRGSVLEVCGAPVNLEMAAYVHAFLTATADRLWEAYREARGIGGAERATYLAGVMTGFREKLDGERSRQRAAGLVWTGDGDLRRYYRRRHPYIRSLRHSGNRRTEAHAHGRAAGLKVVLSRPVGAGLSGRTRLLPARR
jgi:hypothetical protein